jgi:hypothetical protein
VLNAISGFSSSLQSLPYLNMFSAAARPSSHDGQAKAAMASVHPNKLASPCLQMWIWRRTNESGKAMSDKPKRFSLVRMLVAYCWVSLSQS